MCGSCSHRIPVSRGSTKRLLRGRKTPLGLSLRISDRTRAARRRRSRKWLRLCIGISTTLTGQPSMYQYAGEASIAVQRAASWTENCHFSQIFRAVDGLERADFPPTWAFARPQAERDPRLGCKPVSGADSGCLEQMTRGQPLELACG